MIGHSSATISILQHLVFFCGCRNGKTYSSLTSQTGGLPSGENYLESFSDEEKTGGAILAAGVAKSIGIEELKSFFTTSFDYEKIKRAAKHFAIINSDNDPYIPLKHGEILRDKLDAKLIIVPKGDHLNAGNGFFEFPLVLDEILKMAGESKKL